MIAAVLFVFIHDRDITPKASRNRGILKYPTICLCETSKYHSRDMQKCDF